MLSDHVIIDGKRYGPHDPQPQGVATTAPDGKRVWAVTPSGHQHYFDADTMLFEHLPDLSPDQVRDRYKGELYR